MEKKDKQQKVQSASYFNGYNRAFGKEIAKLTASAGMKKQLKMTENYEKTNYFNWFDNAYLESIQSI